MDLDTKINSTYGQQIVPSDVFVLTCVGSPLGCRFAADGILPDSVCAITSSTGGTAGGQYFTSVFTIHNDSLEKPVPLLYKHFMSV